MRSVLNRTLFFFGISSPPNFIYFFSFCHEKNQKIACTHTEREKENTHLTMPSQTATVRTTNGKTSICRAKYYEKLNYLSTFSIILWIHDICLSHEVDANATHGARIQSQPFRHTNDVHTHTHIRCFSSYLDSALGYRQHHDRDTLLRQLRVFLCSRGMPSHTDTCGCVSEQRQPIDQHIRLAPHTHIRSAESCVATVLKCNNMSFVFERASQQHCVGTTSVIRETAMGL